VADTRAFAKRRESFVFCGDEAIAGVFAAADYRETEARWNFSGNIFHAVNGKIKFPVEQSFFQFLDEDCLCRRFARRKPFAICRRRF